MVRRIRYRVIRMRWGPVVPFHLDLVWSREVGGRKVGR